ncbi:MAG TPA: TonB family protein [Pyrinomonadaceae bacterium]|jgi:TonB family protein|nr:TonB family protein [Pyrinomonadaceae bacterium]
MLTNRLAAILLSITFCSVIQFSSLKAYPQQSATASDQTSRGVELYTQGDTAGAISVLREAVKEREEDSRAWHYLGLALTRQGNLKEAREALEKAIKLLGKAFSEEYERAGEEVRDDQLARLKSLLDDELESRKRLIEINTEEQFPGLEQAVLEATQNRADCMQRLIRVDGGRTIFRKSDITTKKARILKKPNPSYTDQAMRERESGEVVLKAVFAADGTVKYIRPVKSLRYGLTEQAIKAAKKIKFEPARICEKPVLQFVQIEYYFSNF